MSESQTAFAELMNSSGSSSQNCAGFSMTSPRCSCTHSDSQASYNSTDDAHNSDECNGFSDDTDFTCAQSLENTCEACSTESDNNSKLSVNPTSVTVHTLRALSADDQYHQTGKFTEAAGGGSLNPSQQQSVLQTNILPGQTAARKEPHCSK